MLYRLYPQIKQTRFFTEKYSRCQIPYRTAKEIRALYPDESFVIIGEIGIFAQTHAEEDMLLTESGKAIPIFPRGSVKKPFEWIAGYIAVGENTYTAAVRSILPAFLRRRITIYQRH